MNPLTDTQRLMLEQAEEHTYADGLSTGVRIMGGNHHRTARALAKKGLVELMPRRGSALWGFARITDAGREVLETLREQDGSAD